MTTAPALDLGELHQRQSDALQSTATEILYGGAAGGGKSHLFRTALIYWGLAVPGLQTYLFRRTLPDLWRNHMDGPTSFPALLAPWVKTGLARINHSKGFIDLPGGSRINLCHCQHAKDVYNYQGAEMHVLAIDELTQWQRDMYLFLRSRVRMVSVKVPEQFRGLFPRIICGANPGGVGHNWVKSDFIDVQPVFQISRMPGKEGGLRRQYIPARLEDNPALLRDDPDYINRLDGLGNPALVKAMKEGDWDIVAGGAIDDVWNRDAHVLEPFEVPPTWRIDRSFDWGSSKPFSVGWWAESDGTEATMRDGSKRCWPRGTIFRIAEMYGWNGKANEGCRMLAVEVARKILELEARVFKGRAVAPGPADSAIYDAENGQSIGDDMAAAGVLWERADKRPGSRKAGLETLRRRLKACLTRPMEESGLFIFSTCAQFIRTVPVLSRDSRDPDDVDSGAEDHVYDETRYRLTAVQRGVGVIHTNI